MDNDNFDPRKFDKTLQHIQGNIACFLVSEDCKVDLQDLEGNILRYSKLSVCQELFSNNCGFFYLYYSLALNLYSGLSSYRSFKSYEDDPSNSNRGENKWFLGVNRLFVEFNSRMASTTDNLAQILYIVKGEASKRKYCSSRECFYNSSWKDAKNIVCHNDFILREPEHLVYRMFLQHRNTLIHRSYIYIVPLRKRGSCISNYAMLKENHPVTELDDIRSKAYYLGEKDGVSHWGQLSHDHFECCEVNGEVTHLLVKDYMRHLLLLLCRMIEHTNIMFKKAIESTES